MQKILLSLFVVFLVACSESGTVTSSEYSATTTNTPSETTNITKNNATVVPGVTFGVTDMYISPSSVYVVFRNYTSASLPRFYADYSLVCGTNKEYGELYFYLNSYEQASEYFYVTSGISKCSLTITTTRTGCTYCSKDNFKPWAGTYTVNTSMF